MTIPLLEVRHVSKSFPGVQALDDVSMTVTSGQIVALLGHNGSGKSTLVKILAGIHRPDPGGEVIVPSPDGEDGAGDRLHFIHQDLGLVPLLNTIENLDLSRRLGRTGLLPAPRRREHRHAAELIGEFGARFDVRAPISTLTPGERAIVAIARALDAWTSPHNVLVLDEPTAALHGDEVDKLFRAVGRVAERGAGIVFISHRLDEVIELADRVVILRNGRTVADELKGAFDHDLLVRMITGQEVEEATGHPASAIGEIRLTVRGLAGHRLHGVDVDVQAGEIVGVSGLLGSGMEHLASTIFGSASRTSGEVLVDGLPIPPNSPAAAIDAGIGFVPADRHRHGAIVSMNARENLTLPRLRPLRRAWGRLDARAERAEADRWMADVEVGRGRSEHSFATFSGGNQQKIVLAKWLRTAPRVLLLEEPTQGVDVGAKSGIYHQITKAAAHGTAVLVASSDTKELTSICDRVIVLRDGKAVENIHRGSLSEARLVRAALGTGPAEAAPEIPADVRGTS